MLQAFVMLSLALSMTAALRHQSQRTSAPEITGVWQMTILGDHGVAAGLDLTQDGNHVTGTFVMPRGHGGRVPLKGDFVDGVLSLVSVPDPDADAVELSINGALKGDGTIEGTLKSRMGERKFTAERLGAAAMAFRPIAVQANMQRSEAHERSEYYERSESIIRVYDARAVAVPCRTRCNDIHR